MTEDTRPLDQDVEVIDLGDACLETQGPPGQRFETIVSEQL